MDQEAELRELFNRNIKNLEDKMSQLRALTNSFRKQRYFWPAKEPPVKSDLSLPEKVVTVLPNECPKDETQ